MPVSPVNRLDRTVGEALARSGLPRGSTVVVAVSGGPDSLALLHALNRAARSGSVRLHGAHLDHQLRGEASRADAIFVAEMFRSLGIEATVDDADVAAYRKEHRLSLEDAARRVRYEFLGCVAAEREAAAIALGHTSDDQAETVLMHLIRGSGLTGLAGMREQAPRRLSGRCVLLLRPMLTVSRQETEAYCRELGLAPRRDESNLLPDLTRNRLRFQLMPQLERFNPAVRGALVRLARSVSLDASYLADEVSRVLPGVGRMDESGQQFTIDREAFSQLPQSLRSHLLRRAFVEVSGTFEDLQQVHVDEMARLLEGPAGRSLDLPSGLTFTVDYESAVMGSGTVDRCPLPSLDGERKLVVPGETRVSGWKVSTAVVDRSGLASLSGESCQAYQAVLDAASMEGPLRVRTRRPGDRFQPLGMSQPKKLQDFMVDSKVPRAWRDRVPLVVAPEGIAWVVGWRPAEWARTRDNGAPSLVITFSQGR